MSTRYSVVKTIRAGKIDKRGYAPLCIVIVIERKPVYISTPHKVKIEDWDTTTREVQSTVQGYKIINADLDRRKVEQEKRMMEFSLANNGIITRGNLKPSIQPEKATINFFDFVEGVLAYRKGKDEYSTIKGYAREINRLKVYVRLLDPSQKERENLFLDIQDMTLQWIKAYETHERNRLSPNSLNTEFKWLTRILRGAYKEKILSEDPTVHYEIPPYIQTEREFFLREDRELWTNCWREKKVSGTLYNTLTYFLLGLYSGLRYSDWHRTTEPGRIVGGNLIMRPSKTKKKDKYALLPIGNTLKEILEVVKTLPKLKEGDKVRQDLKIIAGRLGSTKNVTTHTARHGFGYMCAELNIPISVTAGYLGISEKTAKVYYHLTPEIANIHAAALLTV